MKYETLLSPSEATVPDDCRLTFVETPLRGALQKRHMDRTVLKPELDLGKFKCEACIDVVVLSVETVVPTDFKYIRTLLGPVCGGSKPHLERVNGTHNSATSFHVTVQNPKIAQLLKIEKVLTSAKFGVVGRVGLHLLEVSVNFFPLNSGVLDRELMVGLLHRTYAPKYDVWADELARARFVFPEHGATKPSTRYMFPNSKPDFSTVLELERGRSPRLDSTVYFGPRSGPVLVRIQNKVGDQRNGRVAAILPAERRRARVEVVLSGDELSKRKLKTIDDLVRFNFSSLQGDFFHFALPSFRSPRVSFNPAVAKSLNDYRRRHFLAAGIVALHQWRKHREQWLRHRGGFRRGVSHLDMLNATLKGLGKPRRRQRVGTGVQGDDVAYYELNQKVSEALRNLQKRERRGATS